MVLVALRPAVLAARLLAASAVLLLAAATVLPAAALAALPAASASEANFFSLRPAALLPVAGAGARMLLREQTAAVAVAAAFGRPWRR